jgi:hypothetical protein
MSTGTLTDIISNQLNFKLDDNLSAFVASAFLLLYCVEHGRHEYCNRISVSKHILLTPTANVIILVLLIATFSNLLKDALARFHPKSVWKT